MVKREYITKTFEYNSEKELPIKEQELIKLAKNAAKNAYSPYSEFNVGVCVLLENGETITGSNQENAAYPSGLCAERVAVFYANSKYPQIAISTIVLCAENQNGFLKNPVTPCGACRQVLLESEIRFNTPIKIILYGEQKIICIESISQLLPLHFKKEYLKE